MSLIISIPLFIYGPAIFMLLPTSIIINLLFAIIYGLIYLVFEDIAYQPYLTYINIVQFGLAFLANLLFSFFIGGFIGLIWSKEKSKLFKILISLGILILSVVILVVGVILIASTIRF